MTGNDLELIRAPIRELGAKYHFDSPVGEALAKVAVGRANAEIQSNWTPAGTLLNGGAHSLGPEAVVKDLTDELEKVYQKFNADYLIDQKLGPGVIDAYQGQPLTNLRVLSAGADSRMVDPIIERSKARLADSYVNTWLGFTTVRDDDINKVIAETRAHNAAAMDADMERRIRESAQTKITTQVDTYKKNFESGQLTDAQFLKIITDTKNPNLKNAMQKYWDSDENRKKVSKEKAEEGKLNTATGSFSTEFNRLHYTGDKIDVKDLSDMVKNSPGFITLPAPIQEAINKSLEFKEKRAKFTDELDKINVEEAENKVKYAKAEKNVVEMQKWMKRLAFIAGGMAVGGLGAMLISYTPFLGYITSLGNLSGLSQALLTYGVIGAAGAAGAVAGGGIGLGMSESNYKKTSEIKDKSLAARKNLTEKQAEMEMVKQGYLKKDIDSMEAYATLAANIEAISEGLDKETVVKKYLQKVPLSEIKAVLDLK